MASTKDTSMTGDLIKASAEQLQLEMGTSGDFFKANWQIIGTYITPCWLKSLFQYMQQHDMQFKDPVKKLKLRREKDLFIMNDAIDAKFRCDELKKINEIRMWLRITCKSEICNASGNQVLPESQWDSIKNSGSKNWPQKQNSLSSLHWNLWKKFVTTKYVLPHTRTLRHKLGAWEPEQKE